MERESTLIRYEKIVNAVVQISTKTYGYYYAYLNTTQQLKVVSIH